MTARVRDPLVKQQVAEVVTQQERQVEMADEIRPAGLRVSMTNLKDIVACC